MSETKMTCLACFATTSNGLALCEACRVRVTVDLEFLPVYFRNLARWRPGRAGARPVPGSREPSGGVTAADDRISRALDEVGADIATWVKALEEDRCIELDVDTTGDEAETVAALCAALTDRLTSVATLEWAGEFTEAISRNEARLRGLTEKVAPGWYAGACRNCANPTHVVPGLTWVTCGACGVTTYARDHLDAVIDEARGWVARPMRLAEAAVALLDTEMSVPRLHKRISKWGERGRVDVIRDHDYAPKRFRFGDVLDLLASEGETRLDDGISTKAS